MSSTGTIVVAPATFGYGPASHAVSIARALRTKSDLRIWAVADGVSVEYLERCRVFDRVFQANPDDLPNEEEFQSGFPIVIVAVTDFARAIAAKERGFPLVVVDALYWMWDTDPMDVRTADAYLCLTFPGVADRIARIQPLCKTLKEIPQISEPEPLGYPRERNGVILNFGGGVTPFGFSYDYAASLVKVVQNAMATIGLDSLLVTCSDAARAELVFRGIHADIRSLALNEMIEELISRSLLVTLPGLSIIWEAVRTRIPTLVLPGISYSQHQLVREYARYIEGMSFFTWNDLPGFELLPPGMDENAGVGAATSIADRFATDGDAIQLLTRWLADKFLHPPLAPALRSDHPWGDFSGAEKVADEVIKILLRDD